MRVLTYSFAEEQGVFSQVVDAQQPPEDTDGAFKQVDVHALVEGELCGHPPPSFFKF